LKIPNVEREREFRPDYDVSTGSAFHRDYTRSGYTRGHLAPAGDMAFSTNAMKESFFMSNMSPQAEAFNGGIWRELEENVRDWAYKENHLYVVTGPALKQGVIKKIGDNKVSVPKYFYKVILDLSGKEQKGIGFIIPNEKSEIHLREYAVSIDSVEKFTGINFFVDLMSEELEDEIEERLDDGKWPFDAQRFKTRNSRYK
jgi:endonuclease G